MTPGEASPRIKSRRLFSPFSRQRRTEPDLDYHCFRKLSLLTMVGLKFRAQKAKARALLLRCRSWEECKLRMPGISNRRSEAKRSAVSILALSENSFWHFACPTDSR